MTIRAVLSCDGQEGMYPCRQAAPVGAVLTAAEGRRVAAVVHGWTAAVDLAAGTVRDLCPACTRREASRPRLPECRVCGYPEDRHPFRHPFALLVPTPRRRPADTLEALQ